MKCLIIIPAYNEAENIERVVEGLRRDCPEYDYVVVNDGSKDGTAALCRKKGYNLVDLKVNTGLAGAFQTGMKYAYYHGYDCAIQYDGDGQHNPKYIADMIKEMENHELDIVIGSRFVTQKKPYSARMIGSRLIEICILLTTGRRIKDPTSGMRLFNKRMIKKLAGSMNYGPEPDTIAYLMNCGAKVSEMQVEMNERIAGKSYLSLSRTIRYMTTICSSILLLQWFRKREL